MTFGAIARRYVKSFFLFDLALVTADWLTVLSELIFNDVDSTGDNVGIARIGRIMRATRALRTLRLLRLMKLRQIIDAIRDRIDSVWLAVVFTIVQNLLTLVAI